MTGEEKLPKQACDNGKEEIWRRYCAAKTAFKEMKSDAENAPGNGWAQSAEAR